MNYVDVYIDGYKIDLGEDKIQIPLTYELLDIKNLNKRSGSKSKTVTIPRTAKNDKIFGHAFDINAQNQFSKYEYREIRIEENTFPIFIGLIQLTEVTIRTIKFFCFADISKFKGISGTKTLNDLLLVDLDHVYDITIFDTWDGTYPSGIAEDYFYPPIDYGQFNAKTPGATEEPPTVDFLVANLYPAVYLSRLIRQICVDNGYSLVTSFFDDPQHAKIMIPFTNEEFVHSPTSVTIEDGFWGYNAGTLSYLVATTETIPVNTIVADNQSQWNAGTDEYTAIDNQVVKVDLEGSIILNSIPTGVTQATVFLEYNDGLGWTPVTGAILEYDGTDGIEVKLEFHTQLQLGTGDQLRLRIDIPVEIADIFINITSFKITPINSRLIQVGEIVQLAPNLPPIKQSDLFKWCAQMFGWIIEVNDDSGVINIETYEDYYINNESKDFSNQLNLNIDPVINYKSIDFFRKYNFLYTHDTNDYWLSIYDGINLSDAPSLFGDGRLYLTESGEENTIGKVGFSPTVIEKSFTGGDPAALKWIELPSIQDPSDRITQKTSTTPRILINSGLIEVSALSDGTVNEITYGASDDDVNVRTTIPLVYFQKRVYAESIDQFTLNLSFETPGGETLWVTGNLIDRFYRATIESLSVSAEVVGYFNLSAKDINELDFSVLWYVDYFKSFFRLNRVVDYQPGSLKSTKVELIKKSVLTNFDPSVYAEIT